MSAMIKSLGKKDQVKAEQSVCRGVSRTSVINPLPRLNEDTWKHYQQSVGTQCKLSKAHSGIHFEEPRSE